MAEVNKEIVNIPISSITVNPDNENIFNMDNIEALADSIKYVGFTGSIEVVPVGKNKYEIISGHRRFEAAKLAGMDTVPSIILSVSNDVEKAKLLILSNINNREITTMDKARALEYYYNNVIKIESPSANVQDELARVFHISVTQVKYLRRLLTFVPELQDLLEKELIPYSGIISATSLDTNEQLELAENLSRAIRMNDGEKISKKEAVLLTDQILKRKELLAVIKLEQLKQPKQDLTSVEDVKSHVDNEAQSISQRSVPTFENDFDDFEPLASSIEDDNYDFEEFVPSQNSIPKAVTINQINTNDFYNLESISSNIDSIINKISKSNLKPEEKTILVSKLNSAIQLLK